ncbi:hypothetical protein ACGFZJ_41810 [Streptomyces sp. NPDC048253]
MDLGVMVGLDGLAAHHGQDAGQQGLGLEHSVPENDHASIAFDGAVSR